MAICFGGMVLGGLTGSPSFISKCQTLNVVKRIMFLIRGNYGVIDFGFGGANVGVEL